MSVNPANPPLNYNDRPVSNHDNCPELGKTQTTDEDILIQESPSANFRGRLWSFYSESKSFLLSPILALYHLISNLAHEIFSSGSKEMNTSEVIKTINSDDNIPGLTEEKIERIAKNLDENYKIRKSSDRIDSSVPVPKNTNEKQHSLEPDPLSKIEVGLNEQHLPAPSSDDKIKNNSNSRTDIDNRLNPDPNQPLKNGNIAPEPPLSIQPNQPTIIKIPGLGSCFFMAVAVGLKIHYANDEKINKLLDWKIDLASLSTDLRSDQDVAKLRPPALLLRQLTTTTIERELLFLSNQWENGLSYLEKYNNSINEIEKNIVGAGKQKLKHLSELIFCLKEAIRDYNEEIRAKIMQSIESFHANVDRTGQNIMTFLNENETMITEKSIMSNGQAINRNLREIINYKKKLIKCDLETFNRKDIPELLRYVKVMAQESSYAGYPEAMTLSALFEVPIIVSDSRYLLQSPQEFNPNPDKKAIHLSYDGGHYDLILD